MMNALFPAAGFLIILSLIACQSPTDQYNTHHSMDTHKPATSFEAGKDYTEFKRVKLMDRQGFAQPVEALSMLIPSGWNYEGDIIWTAPGQPCAGTNLFFSAQSPDATSRFDILPNFTWSWSPDPQLNAISQQYNTGQFCNVGEPIDARQFVEQVWAKELGNPEITDIKINPDAIATMGENDEKQRREMMRYGSAGIDFQHSAVTARVNWSDGRSGILFCKVTNAVNYIPNQYNGSIQASYISSTSRVLYIFPKTEQDNAEQVMTVVVTGVRTNPAWKQASEDFWRDVREKNHVAHIGRIRMMDEQTRQIANQAIQKGNQRLADMDNQMRSWEARQSTNDRIHNDFIKTIRGVEHYQDATGTVELSSGYNHAWSRGDGTSFIMTNNPNFDPSSVFRDQSWTEMKKTD